MRITFFAVSLLAAMLFTGCAGPRHGSVAVDVGGTGDTLLGSYTSGHVSASGAQDYLGVLSHPGYF